MATNKEQGKRRRKRAGRSKNITINVNTKGSAAQPSAVTVTTTKNAKKGNSKKQLKSKTSQKTVIKTPPPAQKPTGDILSCGKDDDLENVDAAPPMVYPPFEFDFDSSDSEGGISITQLKALCKSRGIRGYSKKKKNEIVQLLMSRFGEDPIIQKIELLVKNIKSLKLICNELGIRGYSKKNKQELVVVITDTRDQKKAMLENISKQFECKDTLKEVVTTLSLMALWKYCKYKNPKFDNWEKVCQYIERRYEKHQLDIVRMFYRNLKKNKIVTPLK